MVNALSHLGIGLLIASLAGLEGRQKKIVVFLAILPDLDIIVNTILILINGNLTHQMHNTLFFLFGHREFMHSILFILLIIFAVWYYERESKLTVVAGAAIFSHFYLDYATSWKLRPLFPFSTESSIMGSINFFDPLITVISFIPIYFILLERVKENGKFNDIFKNNREYSVPNHMKLNRVLLLILVIWCILTPVSKALLVDHVSQIEEHDISYQNSYPISTGSFLSSYSYNHSHYKILEFNYWSGIEQSMFIPKSKVNGDIDEAFYMQRAKRLYEDSLPKEIDYLVYNVSIDENNVTVILSDARNPYAMSWAYFKAEYIFVFNKSNDEYTAYIKRPMNEAKKLPMNWFE